jgi:hypothetical protein
MTLGVHSEAGKLRTVMVCSPGLAHRRLTPANCGALLFDDVIWVDKAIEDCHGARRGCGVLSAPWRAHHTLTEEAFK